MYPFSYSVSFHVSHPSIDPHRITESLCLNPTSLCKAGDSKQTPSGTPLEGTYEKSHWYCDFPHPKGIELSIFLAYVVDLLALRKSFLEDICKSGALLQISVGWYSGSNSGDEFDWVLLKKLADLQIGLSLDVYAEEEDES